MTNSIDKSLIKGLPDRAQVQKRGETIYVYFAYTYSVGGKVKQDRDYLGKVVDNVFVPNDYYIAYKPTRDHRPVKNWSDPEKRKKEQARLKAGVNSLRPRGKTIRSTPVKEPLEDKKDFGPSDRYERSVGASVLVLAVLDEIGLIDDVTKHLLKDDPELALAAINLGMHAAVTGHPSYLARLESYNLMFIGRQCPTSQQASVVHQKLGEIELLDIDMGKLRASRLKRGDLLALDGTRINCESNNIRLSVVGKKKDGTFGNQINFSMLFNATAGEPICYRAYGGNLNDCRTLEDFRCIWKGFEIDEKQPTILVDRSYFNERELIKLSHDGIKYLCGAKSNLSCVKRIIDDRNPEFYAGINYVEGHRCYGVRQQHEFKSSDGLKAMTNLYVYRNPNTEMSETENLLKRLKEFELLSSFPTDGLGKAQLRKLEQYRQELSFYYNNEDVAGIRKERNNYNIEQDCYMFGYFAFAGSEEQSLDKVLNSYSYRNEVEVYFKEQMKRLGSTRVHSTPALKGLLFTTFIATSAISNILFRMRRQYNGKDELRSDYTIPEMLKELEKVHLVQDSVEGLRLTNVTAREIDIVERLGFPNLLNSAEAISRMLSVADFKSRFA